MMLRGNGSSLRRTTSSRSDADENALSIHKSNGKQPAAVLKTPAKSATKKRRALGDISNRKQPGGASSVFKNDRPKTELKKPPFKQQQSFTPHRSSKSNGFVIPKVAATTTTKTAAAPPKETPRRVVSFAPSLLQPRQQDQRPKVKSTMMTKPDIVDIIHNDVDDVEMPAGRLWKHEQQLYTDDDLHVLEEMQRFKTQYQEFQKEEMERSLQAQLDARKEQDEELDRQVHEMLQEMNDLDLVVDEMENIYKDEEETISMGLEDDGLDDDFFQCPDISF